MKTSFSLKQFRVPLVYLIAINLALKLLMFYLMYPGQNIFSETRIIKATDEISYDVVARNLVNYHTFAPLEYEIDINTIPPISRPHVLCSYYDTLRLPGYPAFVALIYFITGIKPCIAILVQILLSLLCVILVYRICMQLSKNESIASIAGLLYAVDIHSIYVASQLLTDTLCVLLMLASVYYSIKAIQQTGAKNLLLSAIFMGLSCTVRPVMLLFPFIILFIYFIFSKAMLSYKIKQAFTYVLISYVLVVAWSFRNHRVYNHWGLTTQSGYNWVMWNVAFADTWAYHGNIDTVRMGLQKQAEALDFNSKTNPFDMSDIYQKVGNKYLKEHTWAMIMSHLEGGIHMFLSVGNIDIAQSLGWSAPDVKGMPEMNMQRISKNFSGTRDTLLALLILLIMVLQYFGSLIGMITMYRSRNYMFLVFYIIALLYFTGITGIAGMYRYKMPLTPFICIMSGFGFCSLLLRKSDKV